MMRVRNSFAEGFLNGTASQELHSKLPKCSPLIYVLENEI